jgi:uncharacterized protein YbbC (DUF1343 family)
MAKYRHFPVFLMMVLVINSCNAQNSREAKPVAGVPASNMGTVSPGATQWQSYLPLLINRKVGVVANHTSMVNEIHLVDFLISRGVHVAKVFAPEHGFRGEAGPGDKINSGKDAKTGLEVISLYGAKRKPDAAHLSNLDYIIFDIQDVGARFYTFISTLHYIMEACAESNLPVIVLDRPNPNGFYVDGPVLDTAYRSFVGIAPVPVVHGLTMGEYAMMANGEGWLENKVKCDVKVIRSEGYSHSVIYDLPVPPSPNLPNMPSVYLYPSLCFFEGTAISVGRGTELPFQIIGFPGFKGGNFSFTPHEIPGVIKDPPYEGVECNGIMLNETWQSVLENKELKLEHLLTMYRVFPDKDKFFNNFFDKLAGTDQLRKQIIAGTSPEAIRKSWQPALDNYKHRRLKYLLYPEK